MKCEKNTFVFLNEIYQNINKEIKKENYNKKIIN